MGSFSIDLEITFGIARREMVIILFIEVQIMQCWVHWNLERKMFPMVCEFPHFKVSKHS